MKTKPVIAQFFTEVLKNWEGRAADLFRFDQIKNNSADVETVIKVLINRKKLRENLAAEIAQMFGAAGGASGLAACLTENESDLIGAFQRKDTDTQISVLACARLLRAPLPIREVATLLKNPNKILAFAAERYLEMNDSAEARTMIWNARPNEAVILGARDVFNLSKKSAIDYSIVELLKSVNGFSGELQLQDHLDKDEAAIQKEILENAELRMVYAYNGNYIRVYQDRAVYSYYEDAARYHERNLTKEEYEAFQRLIREKNLGSVSPVFECGSIVSFPCFPSQFLMINRNGGRRVFGYADYTKGIGELQTIFLEFQQTAGKLRYELEKYVSGLEVIAADNRFSVKSVWKNADDLRVLVVDKIKETEKESELQQIVQAENVNPGLNYDQRTTLKKRRERERAFENYSWRIIGKERNIGEPISEPAAIPFLKNRLETPTDTAFDDDEFGWKVQSENFQIRTGNGETDGLYKTNRSSTTRLFEGGYKSPLVSSDGKWAIVVKVEPRMDSDLEWLMRVDLMTKREYQIKIPPVDTIKNIAFIPTHNKFLVFCAQTEWDREKDERVNKQSEYYLIDAKTGTMQPVKGEFRPLEQQTYRPLQPTGKPDEFWAAIGEEKYTNVGIYNTKTFTFKPVLKIPEISLTSMDIWVDEPVGKIFFVYEGMRKDDGHLLSLPLPK